MSGDKYYTKERRWRVANGSRPVPEMSHVVSCFVMELRSVVSPVT